MSLNPKLLRKLFAAGAVIAVLVAAGFYLRSIVKISRQPGVVPENIPADVAQLAKEFKFSKSEGGRTLYSIRAASFQQFKEGQRFELHDASITLYGRDGKRSDHIYGSSFQYDKSTGNVTADGEVQIDLEANSPVTGLSKTGAPNPNSVIHLKTSGLSFNENTRIAETSQRIEFQIPEASGSAVGATYDSLDNVLVLKSAVKVVTTGRQKATITGHSASIIKDPQRIIMQGARIEQPPRAVTTDKLTVFMRDDNTVERVTGEGNVRAQREGPKGFDVTAPQSELLMDSTGQLHSGTLSGGVTFAGKAEDSPPQGRAGRILLSFGSKGTLGKVRAEDSVKFKQGPAAKSQEIEAKAVDFYLHNGKILEKAVTSAGPAQVVTVQGVTRTTIDAGQFEAKFNEQNRLSAIYGSPSVKTVSLTPGKPDRITTSRDVTATFNPKGEITSADQTGDFHYQDGTQEGWAQRAHYNPADESYVLSGSPRLADGDRSLTADNIQLNRKTGIALAQGNVKTTYNQKAAQADGAMLSTADPIHVTGASMTANHGSSLARYSAAKLWRGADIVDAPVIVFDSARRTLQAQRDPSSRVKAVFVQADQSGKTTPVNITADKLSYLESERRAVFSGNVAVKIEGSTITADTVQAFLKEHQSQAAGQPGSQLDRIVAQGDIQIQQPERSASGSQLVYTPQDEKFVLTGSPTRLPSIFDAERGQIVGDSLTFFRRDGRVLVGNGESSHTQTQTKVQNADKK
ncbi:MAG TPA: LPS export ABC transporter periplasmic protein LptC [Candidatus Angelobacter sp.]|nr:LPS export ABC transporter periplasmic protein LptC [Candidatus Angelobacter sp.]